MPLRDVVMFHREIDGCATRSIGIFTRSFALKYLVEVNALHWHPFQVKSLTELLKVHL